MSYISFYEAARAKDQAHRSEVAPRDQLSEILGTWLNPPEPLSASTVWGKTQKFANSKSIFTPSQHVPLEWGGDSDATSHYVFQTFSSTFSS